MIQRRYLAALLGLILVFVVVQFAPEIGKFEGCAIIAVYSALALTYLVRTPGLRIEIIYDSPTWFLARIYDDRHPAKSPWGLSKLIRLTMKS